MIANAGISAIGNGPGTDFDRARQIIATNVIGLLNTFEKALTYMRRDKKGHLVAMSSLAGRNGLPGAGPYCASKAAVTTLCESLAIDLRRDNIDVTIVCPGFVKTPLTDVNRGPMPFIVSAEDAAKTIKRAVESTRVHVGFPWPMDLATNLLRILPRSLYVHVMRFYRGSIAHG
jgi:short-subunit dehydrogenase